MEKIITCDNSDTSDVDIKVRGEEITVIEKSPSTPISTELNATTPIFDQARTKTLIRKLDWHLVPFLALLYL